MILRYHDLERSTIFSTAICTLSMSVHVKFHCDLASSFSGKVEKNGPKGGQLKNKERKIKGETLFRTLTLCDVKYAMKGNMT